LRYFTKDLRKLDDGGRKLQVLRLSCDYGVCLAYRALREKLSEAEIESLAAEGAQLSEDQAVAEALSV